ncbi:MULTISPECIES: VOC family protein [unclassified Herbaspirillum]|uniref:VOC family protein n=1 Tax=unclassified Herbaspirillum TaxID=2624150 RepID=UPI00114D576C|nr:MULTISPECIES: VOC family protein [unclassified Herbaspirillum]MBB5392158.1 PhnB protein [Herbaspirillum sp. SJZ102]TQK13615.1 PhnB protein [Herbaspirillum sp. SJZ130]TQK15618.1 PhnB protein [Herbaspirillum sp. SJZ106]TWC71517.1 PhnB protein [Herbaspirillum sp. SJZ099]
MPIQPIQPAIPAGASPTAPATSTSSAPYALPPGYHSVTPYLIVNGTAAAIDFYRRAFGATEIMRLNGPGGKIWHAEIQIGNARVMLADEYPELGFVSPQTLGGAGVSLLVYVCDVDAVFGQAIAAGAAQLRAVQDQFYGDRSGMLRDPYGHVWSIATHIEDLSTAEICARSQALLAKRCNK